MTRTPETIGELIAELGLEPAPRGKNKGKYECPVCGEQKLSIARDGRKYDCYGCHDTKGIYRKLNEMVRGPGSFRRPVPEERISPRQQEKALTKEDWDKGLQALAKHKGCNAETVAELEKRGLTREAIAAAGIFTLPAGRTEVTGLVHEAFPGTYWTQDEKCIKSQWLKGMWIDGASRDSIVIPRFSFFNGSRIGCQLRALGPVPKGDRYRCLYHHDKRTGYKPASGNRLQYGDSNEPGLTFCNPEIFGHLPKTPNRIYLSEGILKPLIASFKHGEIFAGAVGGNFLASPEQFRDFLTFNQAIGVTEIVLCEDHNTIATKEKPDGNPGIVTQWAETYLRIHKEFPGTFEILVAPAAGADIDEVDSLPELISFQAWLAGAVTSSKKIKKMVSRLRRANRSNRFGLAEVWGNVRSIAKKVQEIARNVRQYVAKKSSALVLLSDAKCWESIYPSCPLKPDKLIYDPDNLDSIDWRGPGPMPIIYYQPGTMVSLIKNLHHEFGKNHFLNNGEPGTSKSHETCSAHPDDFGLEMEDVQIGRENGEVEQCGHEPKMWCYTGSPKNPTNAPLEDNFEILPSRAELLYAGEKRTPGGRSYIYSHNGNGKYAPIPNSGTCGRAESHKFLMGSCGYSHQDTIGLLCPTCSSFEECKKGTGIGKVRDERSGPNNTDFPYGFLYERLNTIKNERQIHLHLNQTPTRRIEDGLVGISPISDIAIFDDISLQTTKDYYVNIEAIQKTYWQIGSHEQRMKEKGDSEELAIAEQLSDILLPMLVPLMDNILSNSNRKKFPHGMDDRNFWIEYCKGKIKENPAINAYNRLVMLYTQITGDIWSESLSIEEIRRKLNRILTNGATLRKELKDAYRPEKVLEVVKEHALPQWLTAFLMVAIGKGSVHHIPGTDKYPGKIRITVEDCSQAYRTRAAINIHLNATTTREQLARQIRVPAKDIVVIKPLPLDHGNLTIQGISGFGKLTALSRSKDEVKRLRAIIEQQIAKFGQSKVSLIDHKVHVESGMYDDLLPKEQLGWWFCHNRGTNAFEQYPCRIAIGDPRANLGQLAAQWQASTGEQINLKAKGKYGGFWKNQQEEMRSERIQDVGRLRSGRKEEQCLYLKIGGDLNLDYLREHYQNCQVEYLSARQLTREAAPKGERDLSAISRAIAAMQEKGERPKLAAIAGMTRLTESLISRKAKLYGGFKNLQISLKVLTENCKSSKPLSREQQDLVEVAFPEALERYEAKRSAALARMEAGERWTERIVKDVARGLVDYTMEFLAPIVKMPAVPMRQFVQALSPESQQGLWQAILTLFPSNPVLDELEAILDFSPG